ncbi:hypothetical protein [Frigidibacter sp. MR17.24]|uniref:hypothetical protein n=1 Tax=Frigidibacter sp. MR17.24 TaxID=3127345 RepID=UPI003012B662
MSFHPAALTGLLPLVGAASLMLRAAARRKERRAAPGGNLARMIQMPKEPAPPPPPRGQTPPAAARPCPDCGNDLDPGEARCLPCRRAGARPDARSRRETLLHWAVFAAGLAVIGALGWMLG